MVNLFINTLIKMFFLLTPFFVMSMMLSMTRSLSARARKVIAIRTTLAILVVAFILFYFGNIIFHLLGITLQSFQIGAGALLFISAVSLVQARQQPTVTESEDISVVPLAIPITIGPGTIGTLLVMGTEISGKAKIVASSALFCSIVLVGVILLGASHLERILRAKGISVLTKLTGLVLSALAAQMIFTGVNSFGR
ncbi:MAG: MarC family protein [Phycisphaerales bacterium]